MTGFTRGTTHILCWRGGSKLDIHHRHVAINGLLYELMSIYVGTVNPLNHWLRITFGTRLQINLRELSGFQGIGLYITLRGLPGFRVTLGLVVPEQSGVFLFGAWTGPPLDICFGVENNKIPQTLTVSKPWKSVKFNIQTQKTAIWDQNSADPLLNRSEELLSSGSRNWSAA